MSIGTFSEFDVDYDILRPGQFWFLESAYVPTTLDDQFTWWSPPIIITGWTIIDNTSTCPFYNRFFKSFTDPSVLGQSDVKCANPRRNAPIISKPTIPDETSICGFTHPFPGILIQWAPPWHSRTHSEGRKETSKLLCSSFFPFVFLRCSLPLCFTFLQSPALPKTCLALPSCRILHHRSSRSKLHGCTVPEISVSYLRFSLREDLCCRRGAGKGWWMCWEIQRSCVQTRDDWWSGQWTACDFEPCFQLGEFRGVCRKVLGLIREWIWDWRRRKEFGERGVEVDLSSAITNMHNGQGSTGMHVMA